MSKYKRVWCDSYDNIKIWFETLYASSFLESLNSSLLGFILTLANSIKLQLITLLFENLVPSSWKVSLSSCKICNGLCKMAHVTYPIKYIIIFLRRTKLIWNLNLVERVRSWTTTFTSFIYKTNGTSQLLGTILTSIEFAIAFNGKHGT